MRCFYDIIPEAVDLPLHHDITADLLIHLIHRKRICKVRPIPEIFF